METYIEGRVILGFLCLIHVFAIYASKCPWGPIKSKVLNSIILIELIAVTVYIIYDNLQTPPHVGWFWAIIGYIFVYSLILATWFMYGFFTYLDKDKIYEMTITHQVLFMNKDYFKGTIVVRKHEVEVLLPYSSELRPSAEAHIKQNVKFDNVIQGNFVVKHAHA